LKRDLFTDEGKQVMEHTLDFLFRILLKWQDKIQKIGLYASVLSKKKAITLIAWTLALQKVGC